MSHCHFCHKDVVETPVTICFDPYHETSGGDTHEIIGYICETCALQRGLIKPKSTLKDMAEESRQIGLENIT